MNRDARRFERIAERLVSPIDGKSKQSAKNYIYKLYGKHGGLYRDNWGEIDKIISDIRNGGVDIEVWCENGGYYRDREGHIAGKKWQFKIDFLNEKWQPAKLEGEIIAAFSGTVEQYENDYLGEDRPYDIAFIAW